MPMQPANKATGSPQPILVECPTCHQPGFVDSWPRFTSNDAEPMDRLLQGDLFKYRCPVCGASAAMAYDCLFYDTAHQMVIMYSGNGDAQDACKQMLDEIVGQIRETTPDHLRYQCRLVPTTFEFCEKARILADGYDDRIIELMKVAIKRGMLEEGIIGKRDLLIYERTLDNGGVSFITMGEVPGDTVGVPQGYAYLKDRWLDEVDAIAGEYHFGPAWANAFLP